MGVRTITDDGQTAFYCSTSGWAFGPVVGDYRSEKGEPYCFIFSEDIAERMLKIAHKSGSDIRRIEWTETKLVELMQTAREQLIKEDKEPLGCDCGFCEAKYAD